MRVVSVVGARPQFVKLAAVARALGRVDIGHRIVHTGQHYDAAMSSVFFDDLAVPLPDVNLGVGSGSHGHQTGAMLAGLEDEFLRHPADWVLTYGDTNSTLAAALAAAKLDVPTAHLEAGLRSHDRRMPEEHNRVLTDHASDLLLAPSSTAVSNLEGEGLGTRTRLVGDVMVDVVLSTLGDLAATDSPVPREVRARYVLATVHRPATTDVPEVLEAVVDALAALPAPVILPVHPRLRARVREHGVRLDRGNLRPMDPFGYRQMVAATRDAHAVVTDSGGLQKEAHALGVPCTTLRTETEWVETLTDDWNVLWSPRAGSANLADVALRPRPTRGPSQPYGGGDAAPRVVRALCEERPRRGHRQPRPIT